jgi:hypothetical protein
VGKFAKKLKLKKHKDAVVLLAVILISSAVYLFSVKGIGFGGAFSDFIGNKVYLIYETVDYPIAASEKIYNNYIDLISVKRKNLKLKEELKKVEFKYNRYRYYAIENRELKSLLFLKKFYKQEIGCRKGHTSRIEDWFYGLYINKGTKNGISAETALFLTTES